MSSPAPEASPVSATTLSPESHSLAPIYGVPNEIILLIAESLDVPDLNSLVQTSRRFAVLLDSRLYDLALSFRVTGTWSNHTTVLEWASIHGLVSVIKKLLERNVDMYPVSVAGWNALHNAVHYRHRGVVKTLLDAGFDHSIRKKGGDAVIHEVSYQGDYDILQLILDAGCDISLRGSRQRTALHAATCAGHTAITGALLRAGANVFSKDGAGFTPLHHALFGDHPNLVHMLLDAGSDLSARTGKGFTALHLASGTGNLETVKLLVGLYKEHGLNIQEKDPKGLAAIHLVAEGAKVEIGRVLLENDADVNASDNEGKRALHLAAIGGDAPFARLLLKNGADPTVAEDSGLTPLHAAARDGNAEICEALIEHGADINETDSEGWTPLHVATSHRKRPLVDILLSRGAEIRPNDDGRTPLYLAVLWGNFPIVEQLVERVDKFGVEDMMTGTALHLAVLSRETDMINLLLSKGADPLQLDGYGRTCIDWAALHKPTLELMKPYCSSYYSTYKAVTTSILRNSIFKLATKLAQLQPDEKHSRLYRSLGKCLALANDFEEASISCSYYMFLGERYRCALCEMIIPRELYNCLSCPNISLCSSCQDTYKENNLLIRLCQQHEFARISLRLGNYPDQFDDGCVNDYGESREAWLSRLADSYGQPE